VRANNSFPLQALFALELLSGSEIVLGVGRWVGSELRLVDS
jgi:hypothetical protein